MGNFTTVQQQFNNRVNPKINAYIQLQANNGQPVDKNRIVQLKENELQQMRKDFLNDLYVYTNRNVICYYSTWLQGNQASPNPEVMICDNDINGLMNAVSQLDKTKGLDLILHTPGGVTTATESIVKYLKKIFNNDIRVIVPHMAMSAGTMIACASKEIVMGKESSLGPVDPQYHNVPAYGVLKEFQMAISDTLSAPNKSLIWKEIIGQYRPTFVVECQNVIDLSEQLITDWLLDCMFKKKKNKSVIVKNVVAELIDHSKSLVHDRHYDYEKCKKIGLKVMKLENDSNLQDKVLSIHHLYLLSTYLLPSAIKFIEAHDGNSLIINGKR